MIEKITTGTNATAIRLEPEQKVFSMTPVRTCSRSRPAIGTFSQTRHCRHFRNRSEHVVSSAYEQNDTDIAAEIVSPECVMGGVVQAKVLRRIAGITTFHLERYDTYDLGDVLGLWQTVVREVPCERDTL